MTSSRLKITSVENSVKRGAPSPKQSGTSRRQELQAKMERLWLTDPTLFDPLRDCVQRKRIKKTSELLRRLVQKSGSQVVDIGCGSGMLTRVVRDAGALVDAVDIASNALKVLAESPIHRITPIQDCFPTTKLQDDRYDIVICTEVIGYLNPREYRLAFAELSRLVAPKGMVVCSSSLDVNSDDSLERFAVFAETEFEIDEWILDYDRLWVALCRFFEAPSLYAKAARDQEVRKREGHNLKGFSAKLFQFNTSGVMGYVWTGVSFILKPIVSVLKQNNGLMLFLEKVSRFIWSESAVTHCLFVGSRRPVSFSLPLT